MTTFLPPKTLLTAIAIAVLPLLSPVLHAAAQSAPATPVKIAGVKSGGAEIAGAEIAGVETYLNSIRTLKSAFIQVSDDGTAVEGTFYLSRPGRMRIDYDAPVQNFIVADGRFVFFWDAEMRQQSNAPIGSTLADFLLREDIRLSGDVTVTGVRRDGGLLEVSLVQSKDPGLGQLTLVFEERPLRLRKWRVLDATGQITEVALQNPQQDIDLARDLFIFRDPSRQRERD